MSQPDLEKQLKVALPADLKEVWSGQQWTRTNNVFTLYNYKPFYLLDPADESNIAEESAMLNSFLWSQTTEIRKSVVIAKSFLRDEGQFLFYGFTEAGENRGIWVWHLDQGPPFPSKIANQLDEIFISTAQLINGFDHAEEVSQKWVTATHRRLLPSDFGYGNFPAKDLRDIAEEICPQIMYFPNETTMLIDPGTLEDVHLYYAHHGRPGLINEMKDKHLTQLLKQVNMEPFNSGKETKIFIIPFYNSPQFGICSCTKAQAREFNRFGYFSYTNAKDAYESANFMND